MVIPDTFGKPFVAVKFGADFNDIATHVFRDNDPFGEPCLSLQLFRLPFWLRPMNLKLPMAGASGYGDFNPKSLSFEAGEIDLYVGKKLLTPEVLEYFAKHPFRGLLLCRLPDGCNRENDGGVEVVDTGNRDACNHIFPGYPAFSRFNSSGSTEGGLLRAGRKHSRTSSTKQSLFFSKISPHDNLFWSQLIIASGIAENQLVIQWFYEWPTNFFIAAN